MVTINVAPTVLAAGVAIAASGVCVLMSWVAAFERWAVIGVRIMFVAWLALAGFFVWLITR
jgi:hypothetical protein